MLMCGVDIGGTNVRIVLANEKENLLLKVTSKTIKEGPPEALATQIVNMIQRGLDELNLPRSEIGGIGTSSAGPFVGGESLATPNICGVEDNDWSIIPYITILRKNFGTDKKYELANDCVSSVKAEHLFGAGRGHNNCVYITISTGVGAGIISDNVLLQGKGKNAGHFGHMIVQTRPDARKCGCGQYGCVETIVSGRNIAARAQDAGLLYNGLKEYTAKEVFDLYSKEPLAKKIIDETIQYLGILFINVINATDTDILIVGGSVFLNNAELLLPAVERHISENSMVALSEGVQFATPELGHYVGDLAGLSLVIPKSWIEKWQKEQPWKKGIHKVIKMTTEEAMKYIAK